MFKNHNTEIACYNRQLCSTYCNKYAECCASILNGIYPSRKLVTSDRLHTYLLVDTSPPGAIFRISNLWLHLPVRQPVKRIRNMLHIIRRLLCTYHICQVLLLELSGEFLNFHQFSHWLRWELEKMSIKKNHTWFKIGSNFSK